MARLAIRLGVPIASTTSRRLDAHVKLFGVGVDPHRKLGLVIRKSLVTDSTYADSAIHGGR